jgi:hypothetical protein
MAYITEFIPDISNANNTGEYKGYQIRVKGDGRVESIDGAGNVFMHRNVINAQVWIDERGGGAPDVGPDPEPGSEPVLDSIDPISAELGGENVTLRAIGSNFTETSVIYFNGGAEMTEFVSETEVTTTVKPSLASVAITVPVTVRQGTYETAPQDFEFTETPPE